MHVISSPCVCIFHPSELHSRGCVLVRHGLCTFAFLNLCARDDVLGLSCGSGTYREGPGHQCLPVRLGRLPFTARAGAQEERDGLVQEDAGPASDQGRRGAAATETIRPHR